MSVAQPFVYLIRVVVVREIGCFFIKLSVDESLCSDKCEQSRSKTIDIFVNHSNLYVCEKNQMVLVVSSKRYDLKSQVFSELEVLRFVPILSMFICEKNVDGNKRSLVNKRSTLSQIHASRIIIELQFHVVAHGLASCSTVFQCSIMTEKLIFDYKLVHSSITMQLVYASTAWLTSPFLCFKVIVCNNRLPKTINGVEQWSFYGFNFGQLQSVQRKPEFTILTLCVSIVKHHRVFHISIVCSIKVSFRALVSASHNGSSNHSSSSLSVSKAERVGSCKADRSAGFIHLAVIVPTAVSSYYCGQLQTVNGVSMCEQLAECFSTCLWNMSSLQHRSLENEALHGIRKRLSKRFISRRAKPAIMYNTNAANFVDWITELSKAQQSALRELNPTTASNFGGIWEAAVQSMKFHLKQIVGSSHLTFKELTILFCQIECAFISRPMCSLTDEDLNLSLFLSKFFRFIHFIFRANFISF
ncbi:uncharacterized protein LOC119076248 isoform X1 [Bradysia coprophila]|uniref:uncharacterized protein LOC119076248 isoform X1 n=1 Tax=Bradysia coprophila TaxID=38358 RepID=UPI00187D764E|nr:uncharacterized protein LOC119076248 isoform X1 [Bradysia coprophila]